MKEQTANVEVAENGLVLNFFTGSVPRNYDNYMGPVLFTPYALDLAGRIKTKGDSRILELAAGTGRVTRHLIEAFPQAHIIATDISDDMMEVGKETIHSPNLSWQNCDMADLPFADGEFDLVICQFGLMFVPDKIKALKEMHRVIKTGGQLLFNTWGSIEENPMWKIGFANLNAFLGTSPFPKELGPFGLPEVAPVLQMIDAAGFTARTAEQVKITSEIATASAGAEAFLMTSPALANQPALFPEIKASLSKDLSEKLGDMPMRIPLMALLFEAWK